MKRSRHGRASTQSGQKRNEGGGSRRSLNEKDEGTNKKRQKRRKRQAAKKLTKHGVEQRQTNSKEKRDTARQEKHSRRIAPNNGGTQTAKKRVAERGLKNTCGEKNRATAAHRQKRRDAEAEGEHEKIHKDIAEQ